MSRGAVVFGTCPCCLTPQPLIWDGTVGNHPNPDVIGDCPGAYHAPAPNPGVEWAKDVRVRNAVLHAIEAVTGTTARPYDVDCVLGSFLADGVRVEVDP